MRRSQRLIAAAVLIALSGALAGCSGGLSNFDPSDLLDFLDTKKKLPGERKPVFPEGVPGLEQGVPKELYKGARQEQIDQQNAAAGRGRRRRRRRRRAEGEDDREVQGQAPPATAGTEPARCAADPDAPPCRRKRRAPPPRRRRRSRRRSSASAPPRRRPISRRATGAAAQPRSAQPPQQSAAPFPAPMPSGTFTR